MLYTPLPQRTPASVMEDVLKEEIEALKSIYGDDVEELPAVRAMPCAFEVPP